jgi:hypothetical protein
MPSESGSTNDPIGRLMEWQDHRYDVGYYLGGRIHPILLGRRPNKFGYLLIIQGSAYLLMILYLALSEQFDALPFFTLALLAAYPTLELTAGIKLIQRPANRESATEFEDELDSMETDDDEGYINAGPGTAQNENRADTLDQLLTEPEAQTQPSTEERKSRPPYTRKSLKGRI